MRALGSDQRVLLRAALCALLLGVALGAAACGEDGTRELEGDAPPDELGDVEKADVASQVQVVGGLTLEDAVRQALPAVPKYVGFIVLAPKGADLQVDADGGQLATRVTVYGPRQTNGSWGRQLVSTLQSARTTVPADGQYLVVPQPRYQGKQGTAQVQVRCFGTHCQGYCSAAAPSLKKAGWVHSVASPAVTVLGSAHHRSYDQVLRPGRAQTLQARFTYGAVDKDLEDEDVELWVRSCPGWTRAGTVRTDDEGVAHVTLQSALPEGDYKLLWHVPGDGSTAEGTLAVWAPGRQVAVSDIDGTLTTSDSEVFKQVFLGADAAQYPDAEKVLWTVRRHGYRVQYLTGRPEALGAATKGWLKQHGFPPGPVRLTDSALEVVPSEAGVGQFKTAYLQALRTEVGAKLFDAYGNATTDISAYQANGLANGRIFIVGPHAGEQGTSVLSSYTAHLPVAQGFPYLPLP